MYELWLFLHVLGAIIAFGFGFYAPIFGAMAAREPQHANWYLRVGQRISSILIIPFALSMFVTGVLLVTERGGFARFQELWLALSLLLYVIALVVVIFLQRPALNRVVTLTASPPGPDGPSAEVRPLLRRMQLYGTALLLLTIAILALMVWRPQP